MQRAQSVQQAAARILIVDDEPRILNFVARELTSQGYEVRTAAESSAGLAMATAEAYDLVILDLLMPGLDGRDVLQRILKRNPNQAVIVLSALGDPGSKVMALELGAEEGLVYSELAHQTMSRYGMWQRQLDNDLVEAWIARALAATAEGSPARVKALAANADWHEDLNSARAALALAEELGDVELRSTGLGSVQGLLAFTGEFDEAIEVAEARAHLLSQIPDPDQVANALFMDVDLYANVGRLVDARDTVERLEETVAGLTPHHRLHGVAMRMRLESGMGNWAGIQSLTEGTEAAVEANLATPCPFNVGVLLISALGMVHRGDEGSATRLVAKAESIGMIGYHDLHAARWLNLAIARKDHGGVRRTVDSIQQEWLTPVAWELWAALFDGLAMLEERDRIEAEGPVWIRPDAYVAPFAVRALGIARRDAALLADAVNRFAAMGLDWHAQQTRVALNQLGGASATPPA